MYDQKIIDHKSNGWKIMDLVAGSKMQGSEKKMDQMGFAFSIPAFLTPFLEFGDYNVCV